MMPPLSGAMVAETEKRHDHQAGGAQGEGERVWSHKLGRNYTPGTGVGDSASCWVWRSASIREGAVDSVRKVWDGPADML
jgi:hypothetical protein